ncbi:MAG: hypothetical protein LW630_12785 [Saprospiraceae bacterium]|nr:hypothetical protein [Saprospiraceae bacterium]
MNVFTLTQVRIAVCVFVTLLSQTIFLSAQPTGPSNDGKTLPEGFSPKFENGFVKNMGQILDQDGKPNPAVKYLWNGNGLNVQLRADGFSYDTYMDEVDSLQCAIRRNVKDQSIPIDTVVTKVHRVDIQLEGANPNARIIQEEEFSSSFNYYLHRLTVFCAFWN